MINKALEKSVRVLQTLVHQAILNVFSCMTCRYQVRILAFCTSYIQHAITAVLKREINVRLSRALEITRSCGISIR